MARSRKDPGIELTDYHEWQGLWRQSRDRIIEGRYSDRIFEDRRWNDPAVC